MFDIIPQLAVNSLIAGSIYALVALGMVLTYQNLKVLNFAHGHLMMLGGYIYLYASVDRGWGTLASLGVTMVVLLGVSFIVLNFFIRPFLSFNPLLVLVTTLALSTIIESLVSMFFGVNVKSLGAFLSSVSIEIGSVYITELQIVIVLLTLALLIVTAWIMHSTSFGRSIRAIAENSAVAESSGIPVARISFSVFACSVFAAGLAGILIGYETNLTPTMGTPYTTKGLAVILLGGLGSVWGTILGSYLLATVENFSIGLEFWGYSIPAGYKDAFAFVIILLVLLVRPEGLFSGRRRSA
ncbi:MAG: High-affinity branched-chain amino acid transport system permease protein LivH [Nitrosomonadaceae bacterium]|nr:High-affinity branched-chain amino acid transport system permease protein LivH [Nitrosomonadaceae bacterium]